MSARIIDGKLISQKVKEEVALKTAQLKLKGLQPGLAVIIVGDDPASEVYVKNKILACSQVGFKSFHHRLPAQSSAQEISVLIHQLNLDQEVDGILLQLPLPKHLNADELIAQIKPEKDVDGLHPYNLGLLAMGQACYPSCTPAGMMRMLKEINFNLEGKHAIVIGRSNIVGKPIALLLLAENATVTMCHSKTKNLSKEVSRADLVVAAVGRANFVKKEWIKPGAVVLDVGINRNSEGKLQGDVDFIGVSEVAAAITPVPGGVGPMTIAMLMQNTLNAALRKI